MERPLVLNGFVPRIGDLFSLPTQILFRARHAMAESHVKASKDLLRTRRAELLTQVLKQYQNQTGHVYDSDNFETYNLWETMNVEYGSDAVADVARVGLVSRKFIISSNPVITKKGVELNDQEVFEMHLKWLEENGIRHGWKQDEVPQKTN